MSLHDAYWTCTCRPINLWRWCYNVKMFSTNISKVYSSRPKWDITYNYVAWIISSSTCCKDGWTVGLATSRTSKSCSDLSYCNVLWAFVWCAKFVPWKAGKSNKGLSLCQSVTLLFWGEMFFLERVYFE